MTADLAAALKELSEAKRVLQAFREDTEYQGLAQDYIKMITEIEDDDNLIESRLDLVGPELTKNLLQIRDNVNEVCQLAVNRAIHVNFDHHNPGLHENCDRYQLPDVDKHPVVGTADGAGWLIKVETCNGKTFTNRVIAWCIQDNGIITPVCLEDSSGWHYYPTLDQIFKTITVYHPDNPRQDDPDLVPED